jgi:hypothetical protein
LDLIASYLGRFPANSAQAPDGEQAVRRALSRDEAKVIMERAMTDKRDTAPVRKISGARISARTRPLRKKGQGEDGPYGPGR